MWPISARRSAEIWRVARPGGVVACLEVARPRNPLLRLGHRLYFEQVVPRLTALLGGDADRLYLPAAVGARLPEPPDAGADYEAAGWSEVRYKLLGYGRSRGAYGDKSCKYLSMEQNDLDR